MLGDLTFEAKLDMCFVGGSVGLRRFGMGVRAGVSNETTNPVLHFE